MRTSRLSAAPRPVDVAAIAVGALSGLAVENSARTLFPQARTGLGSLGLVTAAAIYPAARSGSRTGAASARELAAVATALGLTLAARRRGGLLARALIAAGWVAHAAFDAQHDAGPEGRLPDWYPALCAGYDLAFAGALLRPAPC